MFWRSWSYFVTVSYTHLDYDDNGAITSEWSEGLISQKIKEFIVANRHYPNEGWCRRPGHIAAAVAGGQADSKDQRPLGAVVSQVVHRQRDLRSVQAADGGRTLRRVGTN